MDDRERDALHRHKEEIVRMVVDAQRTSDLIYEMKESGIISNSASSYLQRAETTKSNRVRLLLKELERSGPGSFTQFLRVLVQLDLGQLVYVLDQNYYQEILPQLSDESETLEELQRTPYSPTHPPPHSAYALPTLPQPAPPPSPRVDDGEDMENNNPARPLRINVIPYREIGGSHHSPHAVYRNQTMPRGLVFMANYSSFEGNVYPRREGSELDVKNLTLLFTQMGYRVNEPRLNMTKYGTIKALREFCTDEYLKVVDSMVVVVMSHGRDEKSFYTSDNQHISVHELVERFNNRDCPYLKGKPKIFIFQYCRGTGPDIGVAQQMRPVSHRRGLSVQTDSASFGENVIHRDPTFTDMYIIYSTVEGFVSFRHPERGSWLMEALCQIFMNHACTEDLDSLMKRVSRRIRENHTDDGNKQVCEIVQRGFDKHFYFNPQPLSEMTTLDLSNLSHALTEVSGASLPLQERLSPSVRRRLRGRSSSREARRRHHSGASNTSSAGGSMEDLLNLDPRTETPLVHRRVYNLASGERRISLPNPATLLSTAYPNQGQPRGRTFRTCFSESEENLRGATAYSSQPSPYRLIPPSPPAKTATLEEESQDMVDYQLSNHNSPGPPPHLDLNANNNNNNDKPSDPPHTEQLSDDDTSTSSRSNDKNNMVTGNESPMSTSNESVFESRESITSRSPSSPDEKKEMTVTRQTSMTNQGYFPALSSLVNPNGESASAESRYSIKRQLSAPSTKETLEKINDVKRYLQVHDSDPQLLHPLARIESFVNKKKYEGKRRKVDEDDKPMSHSQDY
ncbi:hypothetical protein Pcinc_040804 [Petrolisthes cinctipes]|uniref:Caspase Dronc n=1 Tax=Petrolisthes cinctipes TaxID=88211 RepID=A0AAE1BNV9_PETCI|nr:hypothetical protein Pcinc_040804 [Petrolisthes cinctipes]